MTVHRLWLIIATALLYTQATLAQEAILQEAYAKGPITIEFLEEQKYQISLGGDLGITGSYTQAEDRLTLEDQGGPFACPGKVGYYQYQQIEQELELRAFDDPCAQRKENLEGLWQKQLIILPIVIAQGTLIDGDGGKPQKNMTVIVEGDKIVDVFGSGKKDLPEDAEVISAKRRYILPGLVDSHVHLATDPSGSDKHESVKVTLRDYLYGGITSVRDMGGDGRSLAWLARNAMIDEIESPNIYYSAIIAGSDFFSGFCTVMSSRGIESGDGYYWARAYTLQDKVEFTIAEAKGTGATAIKMYASLGAKELKTLTDEAHRQGMQVWSHVYVGPSVPSDTVLAGVDVISHSSDLAAEVLSQDEMRQGFLEEPQAFAKKLGKSKKFQKLLKGMRKKGIILDATMVVALADGEPEDPEEKKIAEADLFAFTSMAREAHNAGVLIAAGTDMPHEPGTTPPLFKEMQLLVDDVGMTPLGAD